MIAPAQKLQSLPPNVFVEFRKKKERMIAAGIDVIDLGIGDPDLPTPEHIVEKLVEEMGNPSNFKYPNFSGCIEFRQAVADYYQSHYGVKLDPESEILALVGSKEGIANLVFSLVDPGDKVLVPDPGYAIYGRAASLAGGIAQPMQLRAENGFRPDFKAMREEELERAKLMFLNYPGNPTAATVDLDFYREAVAFAEKQGMAIATDTAYNMVTYDGYVAPSLLQAEGAKERAVEFGSLSKTYCMTGWRIGFAVGSKKLLQALASFKNTIDSCQFTPIQKAAAYALKADQSCIQRYNAVYRNRLQAAIDGLGTVGIRAEMPRGGFFVWAPVPDGFTSAGFSELVLDKCGVIVTPGTAFGPSGEGYFRMSMSVPNERLFEAIERIKLHL